MEFEQKTWESAKNIREWYRTHKGKKNSLVLVDRVMAAYGDWYLYRDTETGVLYEEFVSIGD